MNVVSSSGATLLMKTDPPSPNSHQCQTALQLGVRAHEPLLLQAGMLTGCTFCHLEQSTTAALSSGVQGSCHAKTTTFHSGPPDFWLLQSFWPLPPVIPEPGVEAGDIDVSFTAELSMYSLNFDQLYISALHENVSLMRTNCIGLCFRDRYLEGV